MNIAIIGGGLSGTLLAYYMLQADAYPFTIYLFEKDLNQLYRGIAYRSPGEGQLLNVPAHKMNIYGLEEDNFYRWLGTVNEIKPEPEDFVPRAYFGTYLKELFEISLTRSKMITIRVIADEVTDIIKDNDNLKICTAGNFECNVSKAVIANGILPSAVPFKLNNEVRLSGLYQSNPWNSHDQHQLKENDHIVFIGTGLTMLDHAMRLLRINKKIRITALSRRGLLPLPHASYEPYSFPEYTIVPNEDINELFNAIRKYYRLHKHRGLDWRALVDRIRLHIPELWKGLTAESKARFLRHLKPYWEIHRHRAPQQILNPIYNAIKEGRFQLLRGRMSEVQFSGKLLRFTLTNPTQEFVLEANYLLNSSGLQQNISLTSDQLLRNLMQRGYMHPDAHGLGVETDDNGALVCTQNDRNIFAIGALRRAAVLECTAAKEIGEQAFLLSKHFLTLAHSHRE